MHSNTLFMYSLFAGALYSCVCGLRSAALVAIDTFILGPRRGNCIRRPTRIIVKKSYGLIF